MSLRASPLKIPQVALPLDPTTFEKADKTFNCHSHTMRKSLFEQQLYSVVYLLFYKVKSFFGQIISWMLFECFLKIFFADHIGLILSYLLNKYRSENPDTKVSGFSLWRRWRDLNSRVGVTDLLVFEARPFSHLGTSPYLWFSDFHRKKLAERRGFEPRKRLLPLTWFPIMLLRPSRTSLQTTFVILSYFFF